MIIVVAYPDRGAGNDPNLFSSPGTNVLGEVLSYPRRRRRRCRRRQFQVKVFVY